MSGAPVVACAIANFMWSGACFASTAWVFAIGGEAHSGFVCFTCGLASFGLGLWMTKLAKD